MFGFKDNVGLVCATTGSQGQPLEFAQMPSNPRDTQNNNKDACDLKRRHAVGLVKCNT
jgi:hypothetical protein